PVPAGRLTPPASRSRSRRPRTGPSRRSASPRPQRRPRLGNGSSWLSKSKERKFSPCPPLGKGSPSAGGGRNPTAWAWGGARPRPGRGGAEREDAAPPGGGGTGARSEDHVLRRPHLGADADRPGEELVVDGRGRPHGPLIRVVEASGGDVRG